MIGQVVERLHEEGVRVIGRFDFSKINEQFAPKKPEWLYRSVKGEAVNYNGQVHTCVNGGYQQEQLFKILGEAIDKYPGVSPLFLVVSHAVPRKLWFSECRARLDPPTPVEGTPYATEKQEACTWPAMSACDSAQRRGSLPDRF